MVTKAKESSLIVKARKKLKQHIHAEDKHVTPQALDKIKKTIHQPQLLLLCVINKI